MTFLQLSNFCVQYISKINKVRNIKQSPKVPHICILCSFQNDQINIADVSYVQLEVKRCQSFFQLSVSSDRHSGHRPLVHLKSERKQGHNMRHNSLGIFRKSHWSLNQISIVLKIIYGKISAISSLNFKRHIKIRLRSIFMVLWNWRYSALARFLLTSSLFFHNFSPLIFYTLLLFDFYEIFDACVFHNSLSYISVRNL